MSLGLFSVVFLREGSGIVEHFFFTESNGSDISMRVLYQLDGGDGVYKALVKPEGVKDDDALKTDVDEDFSVRLGAILAEYGVAEWDGFDEADENVMDGIGFSLHVTMGDGSTIDAGGYMEWPEGYGKAAAAIHDLFLGLYREKS